MLNQNNNALNRISKLVAFCLFCMAFTVQAKNGFDLSNVSVDPQEILFGGPPRDGIPAINNPKFITVDKVNYLQDDDIVIGLVRGDIARAYPTRILVWHEIVNDVIANEALAITYCPLCGTAMVFDRQVGGKARTFGVSGLLYRSDVLMYDQESESLWSQLAMQAVSGPAIGTTLTWLASEHITWRAWREKYPHGQVLSTDTGYQRNYQGQAYASYFASDSNLFPVPYTRKELPNKDWVIGVLIDDQAKAYPVKHFLKKNTLQDNLSGKQIRVHYDVATRQPKVSDSKGQVIPSVMVFWFAWQAFYPTTKLWYGN